LQKARELGDCLIVGLNSDKSVRRIKGKPRPIINEQERIHLISAIEAVDYVVLFKEDEPIELIKMIKPDILVKGNNLPIDKIVGREIVERYGGKVKRLPCYHNLSTDKLIKLSNSID
jgi:D-beta-D-heptose 7-phosphate kinase/D-beta-D-heptose 1-phosphate adenosyltransferase